MLEAPAPLARQFTGAKATELAARIETAPAEPRAPVRALLQPTPSPPEPVEVDDSDVLAAPATPAAPDLARPIRLTASAVRREIQRELAPRTRACLTRYTRLIKGQQFPVHVVIKPSGEARATATLASSPAARCIAALFERHQFPSNLGGLALDHPFSP